MIWATITRMATTLHLTYAIKKLNEQQRMERCEIKPYQIYNSSEVASLLNTDRKEIVKLVSRGDIPGRLVNGNYRISGQSILEYLKYEA